ncbi:fructose-bisphosphate aldolase [Pseudonocardia thermophila]|uniref:fructose-bisphosphate aldolase n=1 Tax=Pseudonocardia thermophila TaxID=1848 RepID=A0A1M6SL86_PSETH|nr:class I fructose-bisphosphate aldolase [Pseudonocardia thermophila]SHK45544.1 fructose-bisphosphate aldolase [Pseudonocardia thermophila]
MSNCRRTAAEMVSPGRGILAADESIKTMSSRLEKVGIAPTADARRAYREMLVTTPGIAEGISGIIFCDETLNQQLSDGRPFAQATREAGMLPGVKVDTGAKPLAGRPGETITEGLDGLSARLAGYAAQGAAFAKWRAVLRITDDLPSTTAIRANAHALARYAAACQEAGLVPIVEPEVLMDGDHTLRRCAEVTARVHAAVMAELAAFGVDMAGVVLKPNMVVEGADHPHRATPEEVAEATVDVLRALPGDLAGVAFLSGGQDPARATANLAAIQLHHTPWPLTFSFGRALVDPALTAWAASGRSTVAGQEALADRVAANSAAVRTRELQATA